MKELILKELQNDSPDWLLISKLAKESYAESNQSNPIGFRKGAINVIKSSNHNCRDIIDVLKDTFNDTKEYQFMLVGSLYGMKVTSYNKLIEVIKTVIKDKYVIVTDKPQVIANALKAGLEVNEYKAGIKNKYEQFRIQKILSITGAKSIVCKMDELKAHIRNLSLEQLLS
jgi:hypothetical protein